MEYNPLNLDTIVSELTNGTNYRLYDILKTMQKTSDIKQRSLGIFENYEGNKSINIKTVNKLCRALNNRMLKNMEKLFSPNFVGHNIYNKGENGFRRYKELLIDVLRVFPDGKWEIESINETKNYVLVFYIFSGTYKGSMFNGKKIRTRIYSIYNLNEGHIIEEWSIIDTKNWRRFESLNSTFNLY